MAAKILVVEDHAESANTMARLLRMSGYEAQVVSCCKQAMAATAEFSFDLIICDIGLPDGNGCALLRELHRQHGLHGIAITGYGQPSDIAEVKSTGFLHHFVKPVDFNHLRSAVEESLDITMKRARSQDALCEQASQ